MNPDYCTTSTIEYDPVELAMAVSKAVVAMKRAAGIDIGLTKIGTIRDIRIVLSALKDQLKSSGYLALAKECYELIRLEEEADRLALEIQRKYSRVTDLVG